MARSSYIYLPYGQGRQPLGAFTVKHEMETFLNQQFPPGTFIAYRRYRDGHPAHEFEELLHHCK